MLYNGPKSAGTLDSSILKSESHLDHSWRYNVSLDTITELDWGQMEWGFSHFLIHCSLIYWPHLHAHWYCTIISNMTIVWIWYRWFKAYSVWIFWIRSYSECSIFQLRLVGYASIIWVLGAFFPHVGSTFGICVSIGVFNCVLPVYGQLCVL